MRSFSRRSICSDYWISHARLDPLWTVAPSGRQSRFGRERVRDRFFDYKTNHTHLLISVQKLGFFTFDLFLECAYLILKLCHHDHVLGVGWIEHTWIWLARLQTAICIFGDLQARLFRCVRTVAAVWVQLWGIVGAGRVQIERVRTVVMMQRWSVASVFLVGERKRERKQNNE